MRLLCLTHSLSDVDGVGKYGTEVLRRVAPRFDSVEVLIARKHRGVSSRLPDGIDVKVALPPDYLLYVGWPKFLAYSAMSFPKVLAAAGRADIVHCLSDYPHALLAVEAARWRGKPAVVSGHGTYSVAPFRYRGHRALIQRAYGAADALLLGSSFALSKLEEKAHFDAARVVRYGVDPTEAEGAEAFAPPPGIPARYALTIGELKERKGHHISIPGFLAAARGHDDVHLVVIGNRRDGDPYYEARLAEIRAAGLEDRVHFVGNVTDEEKLALLAGAEVFLLTPVTSEEGGFEAFGLVYLEANSCGVPTVGIRDSGAIDAIRDGETGLLADVGDVDGVARHLDRLFGDPELRRRLGAEGVRWARRNDWDATAEGILQVYEQVMAVK